MLPWPVIWLAIRVYLTGMKNLIIERASFLASNSGFLIGSSQSHVLSSLIMITSASFLTIVPGFGLKLAVSSFVSGFGIALSARSFDISDFEPAIALYFKPMLSGWDLAAHNIRPMTSLEFELGLERSLRRLRRLDL